MLWSQKQETLRMGPKHRSTAISVRFQCTDTTRKRYSYARCCRLEVPDDTDEAVVEAAEAADAVESRDAERSER